MAAVAAPLRSVTTKTLFEWDLILYIPPAIPICYVGSLVINWIFVTPRIILREKASLTEKKRNALHRKLLDNGPKVVIGFTDSPLGQGFYVKADKQISNFSIQQIETEHHLLRVDQVHIVDANQTSAITFRFTRKDPRVDGTQEHSTFDGFDEVFDSMSGLTPSEIRLIVSYWERGNEFRIHWFVLWNRVLNQVGRGWTPTLRQDPSSYKWIDHQA